MNTLFNLKSITLIGLFFTSLNAFAQDEPKVDLEAKNGWAERTPDFIVAPNPATDGFSINLKGAPNHPVPFQIVNSRGQVVYVSTFNPGTQNLRVSVPNLSAGLYFVHVGDAHQSSVQKLLIR